MTLFISTFLVVAILVILTIFLARVYLAKRINQEFQETFNDPEMQEALNDLELPNIHNAPVSQKILDNPVATVVNIIKDPMQNVVELVEDAEVLELGKLGNSMIRQFIINKQLLDEIKETYGIPFNRNKGEEQDSQTKEQDPQTEPKD